MFVRHPLSPDDWHGRRSTLFLTKITMDKPLTFEPYQSPVISKLEVHREEIAEMRRLEWPLRKVVQFLHREHQLEVSCSRLWSFCKSRNLAKGRGEAARPAAEAVGIRQPPQPSSSLSVQGGIPSPPAFVDEDISGLMNVTEKKSIFTVFKPKPAP